MRVLGHARKVGLDTDFGNLRGGGRRQGQRSRGTGRVGTGVVKARVAWLTLLQQGQNLAGAYRGGMEDGDGPRTRLLCAVHVLVNQSCGSPVNAVLWDDRALWGRLRRALAR